MVWVELSPHAAPSPPSPDTRHAAGPGLRSAWFLVLPLGLSVVMPLFLVSEVPNSNRSEAWWVTVGILVWSGVRLSTLCVDGRPRLFDFFFWLFSYIFIGLGATVQLRSNEIAITTPGMDPRFDLPAALLVALGLAVYEVGRLLGSSPRPGHDTGAGTTPAHRRPHLDIHPGRAGVLLVVSLLVSGYVLSRVGVTSLFSNRETMRFTQQALWPDPAVRAIFASAATFPLLVAAGALAQLRLIGPSAGWRRASRVALPVCAVLLLMIENPIVSARYTFGTVVFALAVYFGATRTAARVRVTMIGTLFGFLFVFPLADAFRYSDSVSSSRAGFFAEYAANGDYDSFWQIVNAYTYSQAGLVEPLRQLIGSVFFWVPRSLWPGKPTDTGILLANYRGYSFDNLSAPMWAEGLVNGGVIGLVLVFLALGFALARADARLPAAFARGGLWGIVGAILPVYLTILMRGSLLQATGALAIIGACTVFLRQAPAREGPGQPGPGPAYRSSS